MERPRSVTRPWPSVKPDLDNLLKSFFDAWEKSGLLKNDSLITRVDAEMVYAEEGDAPCIHLSYCPMGPEMPSWSHS